MLGYKPSATSKDFIDMVALFLSSKSKSTRHIIFKEDDMIITDT